MKAFTAGVNFNIKGFRADVSPPAAGDIFSGLGVASVDVNSSSAAARWLMVTHKEGVQVDNGPTTRKLLILKFSFQSGLELMKGCIIKNDE